MATTIMLSKGDECVQLSVIGKDRLSASYMTAVKGRGFRGGRVETIGADRFAELVADGWSPPTKGDPGRLLEAFRASMGDGVVYDPFAGVE